MSLSLSLSPSGTITYPPGYALPGNADVAAADGAFLTFPAPWGSQSYDPAISLTITNNSVGSPIACTLMDKVQNPDPHDLTGHFTVMRELPTLQAGTSLTSVVEGLPIDVMYLVLWPLTIQSTDASAGWTVNVTAVAI